MAGGEYPPAFFMNYRPLEYATMRIIDFHAHIFPDRIAHKASAAIGEFYDIPMKYDGTVATLLHLSGQCGIGTTLVHSVATAPQQVASINDFIADTVRKNPGRLVGFATIHPDHPAIEEEIERAAAMGLRGIKIHSDFQRFLLDDDGAMRIYRAIEGRLPILVHAGDHRYEFSKARRIAAVQDRFPGLQMICAHLGGWSEWEESAAILRGSNVVVDTSSSLYDLPPDQARGIIEMYGADRVLFGTDYPMWNPCEELALLDRLCLPDDEREKILHGNAERLFGI